MNPKIQQQMQQQQQQQMQIQQQLQQQALSKSQKVTRKKGKKGQANVDDGNGDFYETSEFANDNQQPTNASPANGSNENLSTSQSTINNSVQSSQQTSAVNLNSSSETDLASSNAALQNQSSTSSTRQIQEGPKSAPTRYFQPQIKTHLYSSTKIGSSNIEKIMIVHDDSENSTQSIVLHSKSTVVCYTLNVDRSPSSTTRAASTTTTR